MYQIEQITHQLTWIIRQKELYPDLPLSKIQLDEDLNGIHFGLFYQDKLISIVSLFDCGDSYQFRKFATLKEFQNQGIGTILLNHIIKFAKKESKLNLWCNARVSAIGFYKKNGFVETDNTFTRDGINFVIMTKDLSDSV